MDSKKNSIRFDEFVKALRPDPKSTPPLVMLTGYIGNSSEEGHIRVYNDRGLNDFVEIPESAVLHAEPNTKEEDPLGGSKLWIKADTVFVYGDPKQEMRRKGSFLQGSLYDAYAQHPGGAGYYIPPTRRPEYCPTNFGFTCPPSELYTACGPKTVCGLICPPTRGICPPPCTEAETRCVASIACTNPPDCPHGKTCVKTCNGPECLGQTSPETCYSPTVPGGPYCRTPGGGYANPGHGFGTFNPYQY